MRETAAGEANEAARGAGVVRRPSGHSVAVVRPLRGEALLRDCPAGTGCIDAGAGPAPVSSCGRNVWLGSSSWWFLPRRWPAETAARLEPRRVGIPCPCGVCLKAGRRCGTAGPPLDCLQCRGCALPVVLKRAVTMCTEGAGRRRLIRPVLKHGPRSAARPRVFGWQSPKAQRERRCVLACRGKNGARPAHCRPVSSTLWRDPSESGWAATRKMVNYARAGRSQGKPWWRPAAVLTCKSIV